jgi:hypothetical protein
MAQAWNSHVNTKFYGADSTYNDNVERITYQSGRTVEYLKNSTPVKTHTLMLRADDSVQAGGRTEFQWFLYWYENVILSGSLSFYLPDVVTHTGTREYKLASPPSWKGQKTKEVSLKLEEA